MKRYSGFTLVEIIICIIILGVLVSITMVGFSKQIKTAAEKKAVLNLRIIWTDEKEFYAYQGRYTDNLDLLSIKKPVDGKYTYEITKASQDELEIKAIPKGTNKSFLINTEGEISEF